jgi:hypothetical protein
VKVDTLPHNNGNKQQHSDYAPNQYPGYLMPDGSWRYGVNAKKLAHAAWAKRRGSTVLKENRDACCGDADGDDVA